MIKTLNQKGNFSIVMDNKTIINNSYIKEYNKLSKPRFINLNTPISIKLKQTKKTFSVFAQLKHFIKKGYDLKVQDNDLIMFSYPNKEVILKGCLV